MKLIPQWLGIQGGEFILHVECKSMNEFLAMPNLISFDNKVFHKDSFNSTHIAFYRSKVEILSLDTETKQTVRVGSNEDGTGVYVPVTTVNALKPDAKITAEELISKVNKL